MATYYELRQYAANSVVNALAFVGFIEEMMAAVGLVRTADTGQLLSTGTLASTPSGNSEFGYSVWALSDSMQSSAPVFLRIGYRSGSSVANLATIQVTAMLQTDGAGNPVGPSAGPYYVSPSSSPSSAPNNQHCFAVHNNWLTAIQLWCAPDAGSSSNGCGFVLQRTVDGAGNPTADGVLLQTPGSTNGTWGSASARGRATYLARFPAPAVAVSMTTDDIAHLPGNRIQYNVGNSPQVCPMWVAMPKVRALPGMLCGPAGATNIGDTFELAVVGPTPRTYMCVGSAMGRQYYSGQTINSISHLLWE